MSLTRLFPVSLCALLLVELCLAAAATAQSSLPELTATDVQRLSKNAGDVRVVGKYIGRGAAAALEQLLATGRSLSISGCTFDGGLDWSRGEEVPVANYLTPEEKTLFGQPTRVRLLRANLTITDSTLVLDVTSPRSQEDVQTTPAREKRIPGILLGSITLRRNILGGLQFEGLVFPDAPPTIEDSRAMPGTLLQAVFARSSFRGPAFSDNLYYHRNSMSLLITDSVIANALQFIGVSSVDFLSVERSRVGSFQLYDTDMKALSLSGSHFGSVIIHGSTFRNGGSFNDSVIDDFLSLTDSVFEGGVTAFGWSFGRESTLSLGGARFMAPILGLSWADVSGPISRHLDSASTQGAWSEAQGLGMRATTEEAFHATGMTDLKTLEGNFRMQGRTEDALACYYFRKVQQRRSRPYLWQPVEYLVFDLTSGYGTMVSRVLLTCLILIAMFSVAYYLFDVVVEETNESPRQGWRSSNSVLFSMQMFLRVGYSKWKVRKQDCAVRVPYPYLSVSFKPRKIRFGGRWGTIPIGVYILTTLEGLCGWFLLAVFIATLTKVGLE